MPLQSRKMGSVHKPFLQIWSHAYVAIAILQRLLRCKAVDDKFVIPHFLNSANKAFDCVNHNISLVKFTQ